MKSFVVTSDVYLQRVPTIIDDSLGIQSYGQDNLYPQRAEFSCERSPTGSTSVECFADFLYGTGFIDVNLGNTVLNKWNQTANDILAAIVKDWSLYRGVALHVNYNLNYRIKSISVVKYKFVRFGLPDRNGVVTELKVCNNWEDNPYKGTGRKYDSINTYNIFDPRPEVVKQQVVECGGIGRYKGQILYFTPELFMYPTVTFDSVWEYLQVQYELGIFDVSKLQNGLTATTIFKYPGEFTEDNPREAFEDDLRKHQGSTGANSVMVVEAPDGASENKLIESIQLQNMDSLHTSLYKIAKNSIRERFRQPAEIIGQLPEGGMFNKESILEAYTYYNEATQKERDAISRLVKKVLTYWQVPLQFSGYDINRKTYGSGQPTNNKA